MFLSKKSIILSLSLIGLLGTPQTTRPDISYYALLPITGLIGLAYCTGVFLNRHANAANFIKYQEDIIQYTTYLSIRLKGNPHKRQTTVLTATNPEEMIEKVIEFVTLHGTKGHMLHARPSVTLEDGTTIQLRKIKISSTKITSLQNILTTRLIVPCESRLTYKGKLILGAIPSTIGLGLLGFIIPVIYYNI